MRRVDHAQARLAHPQAEIDVIVGDRQVTLVEAAEPLMEVHSSFAPNDPRYKEQWNLELIDMPFARACGVRDFVHVKVFRFG